MSSVQTKIVTPSAEISEGPIWQEASNTLLYVDAYCGKLHRYFAETGRLQELQLSEGPTGVSGSFVLPSADDPDVLFVGHGRTMAAVKWSASDPDKMTLPSVALTTVDDNTKNRFNDGKCDPQGRIWAGTMGVETAPGVLDPHKGAMFRFNEELSATTAFDKVSLSNGLVWSMDRQKFFYIDTPERRVDVFDYDDQSGEISNRRTVVDYAAAGLNPDLPDGMTIDCNGHLWVANYLGRKVIRIDPAAGKIVQQVPTVVQNPTSVCWGGPDFSTLYVTSGTNGVSAEEMAKTPQNGAVMAITGLGYKGMPAVSAKISKAVLDKIRSAY